MTDADRGADVNQRQILVVDDEACVRDIACRLLEMHGFETLQACDGSEALAVIQQHGAQLDCVLLDLNMPGLPAQATLEAIHQHCPALPVILCSGRDIGDIAHDFDPSLYAGIMAKPYGSDDLCAGIARARAAR